MCFLLKICVVLCLWCGEYTLFASGSLFDEMASLFCSSCVSQADAKQSPEAHVGRDYPSLQEFEHDWIPDDQHQVRVIYLSGARKYTAMYNLTDLCCFAYYNFNDGRAIFVRSWCDVLRDQFLRSYVLRDGCAPAPVCSPNFGVQEAVLENYQVRQFVSERLDRFVQEDFLNLNRTQRHRVVFAQDPGWEDLTEQVVDRMPYFLQETLWSSVPKESFLQDVICDYASQDKIFLLVRGDGVLEGQFALNVFASLFGRSADITQTLLDEKMIAVKEKFIERYSFHPKAHGLFL